MSLLTIHQAIWYLSPGLQTILLLGLRSRKLHRKYPLFYLYTLSHIVRSLLAYVMKRTLYSDYHYFYWATEVYFGVLCLLVLQEAYDASFAGFPRLRRYHHMVFQVATGVLILTCLVSGYLAPGSYQVRVPAAFFVAQRSLDILVGGLSFALLASLRVMGLSWQARSAGIALGFAVNSAITFAAASVRSESEWAGARGIYAVSLATAYALALVIWNVSILRPIPEAHTPVSAGEVETVGRWKRWLEGVRL